MAGYRTGEDVTGVFDRLRRHGWQPDDAAGWRWCFALAGRDGLVRRVVVETLASDIVRVSPTPVPGCIVPGVVDYYHRLPIRPVVT